MCERYLRCLPTEVKLHVCVNSYDQTFVVDFRHFEEIFVILYHDGLNGPTQTQKVVYVKMENISHSHNLPIFTGECWTRYRYPGCHSNIMAHRCCFDLTCAFMEAKIIHSIEVHLMWIEFLSFGSVRELFMVSSCIPGFCI